MVISNLVLTQSNNNSVHTSKSSLITLEDAFLQAASSLFAIAARIKKLSCDMYPLQLQAHLIQEIHQLERKLQHDNVRAEQILIAKYFICALLDDVIENEWLKGEDLWRAYALRFYFFQDSSDGERTFTLIERLQQGPSSNIALLKFAYMILIYGYQGPFRQMHDGYYKLLEKIDELYHLLNWQHGEFRKNLFIQ